MASEYDVCIMHRGTRQVVASWPPSRTEQQGDVIDAVCAAIRRRGVGVGRTEAHVLADVRAAWHEILHALKAHV